MSGAANVVHSVDSSAKAIEMTNQNVELNFPSGHHEAFVADAFDFMQDIKDKYDLIVLDPPAFAKHKTYSRRRCKDISDLTPKLFNKSGPEDCSSPSLSAGRYEK